MKVMTIVGTRPEVIKLSRVITELDKHVDHTVIHTGQNYDHELNGIFFEELGLRPPGVQLHTALGFTACGAIGNILASVDYELELRKPDAVLLLGDTNSTLSAYAARRRHIPIFHMEAGNRCFDERVPEEINRRIVDHISDVNLPYTEHARRNLLAEGIAPDRIVKTGSPMLEVLHQYWPRIDESSILKDKGLQPGGYFVVSAHREENVDSWDGLRCLATVVDLLAASYCWPVIVPLHPRTAARMKNHGVSFAPRVHVCKPLGFFDYAKLQSQAACVISDSGTITEESAMMGFPAVTIRRAHERPEGSDEGTLIRSDIEPAKVLAAIKVAMAQADKPRLPPDYEGRQVAQKVVRTILSYTDVVRRQYR